MFVYLVEYLTRQACLCTDVYILWPSYSLLNCKANLIIALHFVGLEPVAGVDCVRIALGESLCQRPA